MGDQFQRRSKEMMSEALKIRVGKELDDNESIGDENIGDEDIGDEETNCGLPEILEFCGLCERQEKYFDKICSEIGFVQVYGGDICEHRAEAMSDKEVCDYK